MRKSKRRGKPTLARRPLKPPSLNSRSLSTIGRSMSTANSACSSFQHRVLEEAEDETNPLLERVKFLSIVGSNLDEFFMVRVAGLIAQVEAGSAEAGPDGMSPSAQLVAIRREVKKLLVEAHHCWRDLSAELRGVRHPPPRLRRTEREAASAIADAYFRETVFPVLTPLAFDPGRPFPHISNRSLNLAVLIRDSEGQDRFARIKVPDTLAAVRSGLTGSPNRREARSLRRDLHFVWLEQVIAANLAGAVPRDAGRGIASVPRHARRRGRHQGTGSRGSARNHRGGRAAAPVRRCRPTEGHGRHARNHAGHPDVEPGGADRASFTAFMARCR